MVDHWLRKELKLDAFKKSSEGGEMRGGIFEVGKVGSKNRAQPVKGNTRTIWRRR